VITSSLQKFWASGATLCGSAESNNCVMKERVEENGYEAQGRCYNIL
jgi:hypothetical protein